MLRIICLLAVIAACGSMDAPQLPPTPGQELVNSAGRLKGTTYTLDVELGRVIAPKPASGSKYRIEPDTTVKP